MSEVANKLSRLQIDERVARTICAFSLSGFCQNVGGNLGCKVGRGEYPSPDLCVATRDQLHLSGNLQTAQAVRAHLANDSGEG